MPGRARFSGWIFAGADGLISAWTLFGKNRQDSFSRTETELTRLDSENKNAAPAARRLRGQRTPLRGAHGVPGRHPQRPVRPGLDQDPRPDAQGQVQTMNKIQRSIDAVWPARCRWSASPTTASSWPARWWRTPTAGQAASCTPASASGRTSPPRTERRAPTVPWARSLEQAFIDQRMTVALNERISVGDLVFSRLPADVGHVGVVGLGTRTAACMYWKTPRCGAASRWAAR